MKANEMALEFMDLLQKISSGDAPSLEDFELSYALSTAEEEFVKTKYSSKSNIKREGFENSEKRRKDLSQLVTNAVIKSTDINVSSFFSSVNNKPNGSFWYLPEDLLWVINEEIIWDKTGCYDGVRVEVKPIEHDRYNVLVRNTFTKPYEQLVYRLDYSSENNANTVNSLTISGNPYIPFVTGNYEFEFDYDSYGPVTIVVSATSIIGALTTVYNTITNDFPNLEATLYLSTLKLSITDKAGGSITVTITGAADVFTSSIPVYPIHELVTHGWNIKEYHVRYIKKPSGIIVNFDDTDKQIHSVLNPSTHKEIIALAVKNTLASLQDPRYQIATQDNLNKE